MANYNEFMKAEKETALERYYRKKAEAQYKKDVESQLQPATVEEETNKGGVLGGLGYGLEKLGLGALRSIEGIGDYLVGGAAKLFGQHEFAEKMMQNDWVDYNHADEWYNPSGVMGFVGDVSAGVGGMLPSIALVAATGGAGAPAALAQGLGTGAFMLGAAGQSVSDAAKESGAAGGKEWAYGTLSGAAEGAVEAISGGLGGTQMGKVLGKQVAKSTGGKLAATFIGEGLEEVASDFIDPALKRVTGVDKNATVDYSQLPNTFLVGGTTGAVLGGASRVVNAAKAGGFNNLNAIENTQEYTARTADNNIRQAKGKTETYTQADMEDIKTRLSQNLQKMSENTRASFFQQNPKIAPLFEVDGRIKSASENVSAYNQNAYSASLRGRESELMYKPVSTQNKIGEVAAQSMKNLQLITGGNSDVVLTDTPIKTADGRKANGAYIDGILYVDANASADARVNFVASHELVHTLEGTQEYAKMAEFADSVIAADPALAKKYDINKYLTAYANAQEKNYSAETRLYEAQTERIADFMANEVLTNPETVRRLASKNENLVKRILEWLRTKIKQLKTKGEAKEELKTFLKAERLFSAALENRTGGLSLDDVEAVVQAEKKEGEEVVKSNKKARPAIVEGRYSLQDSWQELGQYSEQEILSIERNKTQKVARSYEEIKAFINEVRPGAVNRFLYLGKISDSTARLVEKETGLDVSDKSIVLSGNDIQHIFNRHGETKTETQRGQIAVTRANIENIIETIIEPDSVKMEIDKNNVNTVIFEKSIQGKNIAITVLSNKKNALTLKSARIMKEQYISPLSDAEAPHSTSKTLGGLNTALSDNSISEKTEKVNDLEKKSSKRFSIAGENSKTLNKKAYQEAQELYEEGENAENIFAKTGFFKGFDGKWRYEISDETYGLNKNDYTEALIAQSENSLSIYTKNLEQFNNFTPEQKTEYDKIHGRGATTRWINTYNKSIAKLREKIEAYRESETLKIGELQAGAYKLSELVSHKNLFEAYPELENLKVNVINDSKEGYSGYYDSYENEITINNYWARYDDLGGVRSALIHELQHVIQQIEGLAKGASTYYWKDEIKRGKAASRTLSWLNEMKRLAGETREELTAKELDKRLKVEYESLSLQENIPKAQERRNAVSAYDNPLEVKTLEKIRSETGFDKSSSGRSASDLYENTYGEQEARDTQERLDYTEKQRLERMPFAGNEKSVVRFSLNTEESKTAAVQRVTETQEKSTLKEKAKGLKEAGKFASLSNQINFTNAQAGIESAAKALGVKGIEAKTHKARTAIGAAENMIALRQFDYANKEVVGKSLTEIFKPIQDRGDAYTTDFYEYLLHMHNIDRMSLVEKGLSEENKPVFGEDVTAKESRVRIKELRIKHPGIDEIAKDVWNYNDNLLQYRVDAGLITQEQAETMRKMYPHYVPTFRDTEGAIGSGGLGGKYNLEVKKTIKSAKGSDLDILDLSLIMGKQTLSVVRAAAMNDIMNSLYEGAEKAGSNSYIEIKETRDIDGEVDYAKDKPLNNEVSFYKDGKRITMRVSPEVFAGFEAYSGTNATFNQNIIVKGTQKINKLFKQFVTEYNPFFLVRNFVRDFQEAMFYTKQGVGKFIKNLPRAIKSIKAKDVMWQRYQALGGTSNTLFDYEKGIYNDSGKIKKGLKKVLGVISAANSFIEQIPRFNEFMLSVESGKTYEQALLDSADVTTNFTRGGKLTKMLNSTVMPFLNPSVQGWSKLWRTATGRKTLREWGSLIVRALILGIGASALNDLLNGDDEDYQALNMRDKENYYLFKAGDTFIKIPKGRVTAAIGTLYLRLKDKAEGNENAFDGWLSSVLSMTTPADNMTRTIFSPVFDVANNRTWYGSEIEGKKFENIAPADRYDESTSKIAIALGKVFNYSPKKIHYLIDQYSGVIGDIVLPPTTNKAERGIFAGNFTIDPVLSNKYSEEFYSELETTQYAKSAGDPVAALKVRYLKNISSAVSEMYQQKREIANSNLSDKEKQAQTRVIQALINETLKNAVEQGDNFEQRLIDSGYEADTEKLLGNTIFKKLSEKKQASAAQKFTDYYYSKISSELSGERLSVKYNFYKEIGAVNVAVYLTEISEIEADQDKNGNTVSGSRKQKVHNYIDKLKLSALQKYMLLILAGYKPAEAGKEKVKAYLKKAGFTEDEIDAVC